MAEAVKVQPDQWGQNPCRVTSFLAIPLGNNPSYEKPLTYNSPPCGFGWAFLFNVKSSSEDVPSTNSSTTIEVTYKSESCSGFQLKDVSFHVVAKLQGSTVVHSKPFVFADNTYKGKGFSIAKNRSLGIYTEPPNQLEQMALFELTIIFNSRDKLSFPSGPSIELNRALTTSLDGKHMMDTKFYLCSSKLKGKPTRPRALYGNASVLKCLSSFFDGLLSDGGAGFQAGTRCQFHEDLPEVVGRLEESAYGFDADSDSDLEDEDEDEDEVIFTSRPSSPTKGQEASSPPLPSSSCVPDVGSPKPRTAVALDSSSTTANELNSLEVEKAPEILDIGDNSSHAHIVSAFAINATAHQTWKALLYYAYTEQIYFKNIKSGALKELNEGTSSTTVACSPKSMYRLANRVGIPALKKLAKQKILTCICERNVVEELFSSFTSRYKEIIEMEADYLVSHFTPEVSYQFTNMLHKVVSGAKPYCQNILSITIQKLYNHTPSSNPDSPSPKSSSKPK